MNPLLENIRNKYMDESNTTYDIVDKSFKAILHEFERMQDEDCDNATIATALEQIFNILLNLTEKIKS